jgi:DNA-binding response OmpR family regulator
MRNILLVTPSLELSEKDMQFLDQNSIKVHRAASGAEAKQLLSSTSFEVAVAELELDDMSGDALCTLIKEKDDQTYVMLACSGKTNELKACGRCGANAHIQTPLEPESLMLRISSILKVPRKRATRVLVKVKVNGSIKSEPFFSISHNISSTGMMLEAEQSLAIGDIVSCSFYLPETERMSAPCKVVRIDKASGENNRYGVEFVDLDNESIATIDGFILQEREAGNFF